MNSRGLKKALHLLVAASVALTSLTLTPVVAQATQAPTIAANPAMVCSGATCSITFPYVAGKHYEYTPIAGAEVTIQVNGGAGGNGGGDGWSGGGTGSTGSRVTQVVTPASGSVIKIYPGSAGTSGVGGSGVGGGAGGLSTYDDDVAPFNDYNGGNGGNPCNEGSSGGGGGGGAASVVQIVKTGTTIPLLIAGGGGGAAGANQFRGGAAGLGPAGNGGTVGGVGASKWGCDGAGAGGGGGGLQGGYGGSQPGYDGNGPYEWYGTGGYSGTSTPAGTGITTSNNVAGLNGNGFVVVSFLNLYANITASEFTNASEITFNVTFPRDVTGITASDFSIDTAVTTATGCAAPSALTGSGSSYTIKVTGCSEGFLGIKLADAAAVDANSMSTWLSLSNKVTLDRTAASLTVTGPATPSNAATLNFSVATNEALAAGSLTSADLSVSGAG